MNDFADNLSKLIIAESVAAAGNAERSAEMLERLGAAVGMAVAIAAQGDRKAIDELMTGLEAYALQEAARQAPLAFMVAERKSASREAATALRKGLL